jgi:molybdopterin-guanine dinucleotide biosynthesis protein A
LFVILSPSKDPVALRDAFQQITLPEKKRARLVDVAGYVTASTSSCLSDKFGRNDKRERRAAIEMTFTAVLLAGGESRRMGKDKATIVFRGQPLWQRQIELLRSLRPEKIFISARKDPSWLPSETESLLDEPPFRGPLSGLTRALVSMQTSHLAVLAIDMPFMTSEQMRILWRLATTGCGVLPMIGDRAEPLAAIYPREAGTDFRAALAGHDFSLQKLVRNLATANLVQMFSVPAKDEPLYRSVNEPGDFQGAAV